MVHAGLRDPCGTNDYVLTRGGKKTQHRKPKRRGDGYTEKEKQKCTKRNIWKFESENLGLKGSLHRMMLDQSLTDMLANKDIQMRLNM